MSEHGTDYVEDQVYSYQDAVEDKNHNRMSDPVANLSDPQPGMILSDGDDDRLYHVGEDSDIFDEVLQENRSEGAAPRFSSLFLLLVTETLEIIDAGTDSDTTEQDWIEVEVDGVQGYLRVFAAK